MAVRFCFAARTGCRLARSESGSCRTARPHPLVGRFLADRTSWTFVGLLALQGFLPTVAFDVCGGVGIDCRGGLDCFLAAGSLTVGARFIRQPPVEERISPTRAGDNFLRGSSKSIRSECRGLRYR